MKKIQNLKNYLIQAQKAEEIVEQITAEIIQFYAKQGCVVERHGDILVVHGQGLCHPACTKVIRKH